MTLKRALIWLPIFLLACNEVPVPSDPAVPIDPMPPAAGQSCGAEGLQDLVGRDAAVLQTIRFGTTVRIIRPGMAVTMDFQPERLNIHIDANEKIRRVTCG